MALPQANLSLTSMTFRLPPCSFGSEMPTSIRWSSASRVSAKLRSLLARLVGPQQRQSALVVGRNTERKEHYRNQSSPYRPDATFDLIMPHLCP